MAETGSVIPEAYQDMLAKKGFAHLATLGPEGEPHSSPVWYDWDGEHLLVSNTTARQKYRNVTKEKRVALSILDPDNPYRYLEVRGEVADLEQDPDKKLINALAKKYMGQDEYPYDGPEDHRVIIKIKPLHTTAMG